VISDPAPIADYNVSITLLSIPGKAFNRVLLNSMTDAIDPQLREQKAGFPLKRSCTDQITTLHIILAQSPDWNSPLYINFVDYENKVGSVDRQTLWKLLRTLWNTRISSETHMKE